MPSEGELHALWDRYEAARRERERAGEWRRALEETRRDEAGRLHSTPLVELPPYVRDRLALGPQSRAALRPSPREGRVLAVGVDTWSPGWYATPGSPLARAMGALATRHVRFAHLLPDRVGGYRVGWFPESGLVFAEGRPAAEALCRAADLAGAMDRLQLALTDLGLPIAPLSSAGLRRLDVATDLWLDSAAEGLALLECVGAASLSSGKLVAYRADRCVESVLVKSRAGRTLARIYDKGVESSGAPRGHWLRLEAQWRLPRHSRIDPVELDAALLRERFQRRFQPLWQAAGGFRLGGLAVVGERIEAALASGQLVPSRARSVAGYLVLAAAGIAQGAKRTTYELERECRQLGLSLSLLEADERNVDVAAVLDECLAPAVWG
jgi:hypothetical protein